MPIEFTNRLKKGKNPRSQSNALSQNFAERTVFRYILRRFEASVQELANQTGMPGSTIAGILNRLVARGLLVPNGTKTLGRGRPSIYYRARIPRPVCACQLDGTQVAAAVFDSDLKLQALEAETCSRIKSDTAAVDAIDRVLARLRTSLPPLISKVPDLALSLNAIKSNPRHLVSSVLPWVGLSLEKNLSERLATKVRIVSQLAPLIAEIQRLEHPVPKSFVRLRVADGVSAHMAINGETYLGHSRLAGELGHLTMDRNGPLCGCGRHGCLEVYCGGVALHQRLLNDLSSGVATTIEYEKVVKGSPRASVGILWEAWKSGDAYAHDFMRRAFDRIATAVGIVMNLLDPELILTGGYVLENRPEWVEEIRNRAQPCTLDSPLRPIPLRPGEATLEDELRVTGTMYFYKFSGV